jgi:hypothetical protein
MVIPKDSTELWASSALVWLTVTVDETGVSRLAARDEFGEMDSFWEDIARISRRLECRDTARSGGWCSHTYMQVQEHNGRAKNYGIIGHEDLVTG